MSRNVFLIALLLASVLAPAASAQTGSTDVAVAEVDIAPAPVVGVSSIIHALVNSTSAGSVTVTFTYADGAGVQDSGSTGGSSFTVVKFLSGPGPHDVNLTFKPGSDRRGPQDIVVRASATGDTNASNDVMVNHTFIKDPALNVTFDAPSSMRVLANASTPLRFFVKNLGNANDTPIVLASTNDTWSAQVLGSMPDIPPQGSAIGFVLVTPLTSDPNATLNLTLTALSGLRTAITATAIGPPLSSNDTAIAIPRALTLDVPDKLQLFGQVHRLVNVTLANAGAMDEGVLVNATAGDGLNASFAAPPDWPANVSQPRLENGTTLHFALAAGESRALTLDLVSTDDAAAASGYVLVRASTDDADQVAARGFPVTPAVNVTIVPARAALNVTLAESPGTVYEGDTVHYGFDVGNDGLVDASNCTVDVEVRDNLRSVRSLVLDVPALPAGATHRVGFDLATGALQGLYSVSATLVTNQSVDQGSVVVPLDVRSFALSVTAPSEIHGVPGETIRLRGLTHGLSVENDAPTPEAVDAWLDSSAPWASATWHLSLATLDVEPLPLDLAIPAAPGVQEVSATLHARLVNRTDMETETNLTIVIDDATPPTIGFAAPPDGAQGVVANITARVQDATGVGQVELRLVRPSGERFSLAMLPDQADPTLFRAAVTPDQVGAYVLQVEALDNATPPNRAQSDNVTWNVTGAAFGGLVPDGFADGAIVSTRDLRFREAVEGTVATASVDVGTGAFPLAYPFVVTLPANDSAYVVRIVARGFDGQTSTQTWNVTLQTQAPTLANATAARQPDGRVAVSLDLRGTANVTVRFETSSGPIDYPLSERRTGHVAATVTPPPQWDRIDAIARDRAGNEASIPFSVNASKTPVPAWAAFAGAAIALALARGRRRR